VDYLKDFTEYMKAAPNIRDKSYKQAHQTTTRVRNIIEGCGFTSWRDVNADKIQLYLSKLEAEGMKPQTVKFYTKAFERFAGWMVKQGYAASVPELATVKVRGPLNMMSLRPCWKQRRGGRSALA
jgi:site-specific recombinase XerD